MVNYLFFLATNKHEISRIYQFILKKLGTGGFGEVWLAEKRSQFVTKKVAVKLPLNEQIDFQAISQEAELWEQASGHANVLPIIDADIIDGQVVIVSEYAEGGSLADKLKREGKLPIKQAVEMTIGILNGLEFLHNKRIIHRDIKPANILLQGDNPRLADFGISRAMQTSAISSTIIGTDAYMSPESFRGLRTIETDIWSVGVVLYQLLNGRLPFPQENPSEKMYAILQENFSPLSNDIPQDLRRIVEKALAKLPENRYKTVREMRDNLQQFLSGKITIFDFNQVDLMPKQQITLIQHDVIPTFNRKKKVESSEKVFTEIKARFRPKKKLHRFKNTDNFLKLQTKRPPSIWITEVLLLFLILGVLAGFIGNAQYSFTYLGNDFSLVKILFVILTNLILFGILSLFLSAFIKLEERETSGKWLSALSLLPWIILIISHLFIDQLTDKSVGLMIPLILLIILILRLLFSKKVDEFFQKD